jgi:hypothetical protein
VVLCFWNRNYFNPQILFSDEVVMDFPTRDLCMEIVRKNFMQSQVAASRVLRALDGCSEASGLHSDRKPWFSITDLHSES